MTNELLKKCAVIIIPTYNEAGNIGHLIDEFFTKIFPQIINWNMKILVVDGNSTDKTVHIVREKAEKWPNIYFLVEKKKTGIGSAYLQGFSYSIDKLGADVVIEFDGDFQHPPESIIPLMEKMTQGYDYVLGSRKIAGGSEPAERNPLRSFMTNVGGLVARFILFFPGKYFNAVSDPTSGLKATRVKGVLDSMNLKSEHLYSKKFGYKVQLLLETLQIGARYGEIPLTFRNREAGFSKFQAGTIFEILMSCARTRIHERKTVMFLSYATVGFIGYVVSALLIELLPHIIATEPLVWALATEVAIISNFILNNFWTFSSQQIHGKVSIFKKFLQFNMTSGGALILETTLGTFAVWFFGEQYRQLILPIIVVLVVVPYNWYMYRRFIWKK